METSKMQNTKRSSRTARLFPGRRFSAGPVGVFLALALCLGLSPAIQAQAEPAAAAGDVQPEALAALESMGAYLRTLKAFQVEVKTFDEDVLDDGQKILYSGATNLLARMPDRLRAETKNDRFERLWLYDGSNFTLFAKRLNFYATIPAPDTIGKLADDLEKKYGFGVPLEDLFRWGAPGWTPDSITGATDVGAADVNGVTCEQYAFRQQDIDWQIWIQKGDFPLPLRLLITTKTDEARPQHYASYTWNLAPSFNEAAFVFEPDASTHRVVLEEVPADADAGN